MIYIKEDKAKRLAGNTAIFISFSFNKDIIHIIKSSGTYAYDKKTHMWELPVNSLAFILDNLTYFDDITLIIDGKHDIMRTPKKLRFNARYCAIFIPIRWH